MDSLMRLDELQPGQSGTVAAIHTTGAMRRRFLDIGLIEDTLVECVGCSPGGDPHAFLIRGAVIAIRADDSRQITVRMRQRGGCHGVD